MTEIVLGVIGDYGVGSLSKKDKERVNKILEIIKSWNPYLILTLGDNNYPKGAEDTFKPNVGYYLLDMINQYKVKPVLGNHDWYTYKIVNDHKYPYVYHNGFKCKERYYDYIVHNVHFFALDSDSNEPDGTEIGSKQYLWFEKKVLESQCKYKVVYLHHHPYGSDSHHPEDENKHLRYPFAQLGVQLVMAGHIHVYERLFIDNVHYVINGIGGTKLRKEKSASKLNPNSKFKYNDKNGVSRIVLRNNKLIFETYNIDNQLIDHFKLD